MGSAATKKLCQGTVVVVQFEVKGFNRNAV